jgi:hypothetical protein
VIVTVSANRRFHHDRPRFLDALPCSLFLSSRRRRSRPCCASDGPRSLRSRKRFAHFNDVVFILPSSPSHHYRRRSKRDGGLVKHSDIVCPVRLKRPVQLTLTVHASTLEKAADAEFYWVDWLLALLDRNQRLCRSPVSRLTRFNVGG